MAAGPLDRLRLTDSRLDGMANGLRTVAALPDPVGEVLDGWKRPNGLQITAYAGAARRDRDHLREPSQRHERRRRALREGGQRGAAAGQLDARCGPTSRSQTCCATRSRSTALPDDAVILVEDTAYETATQVMQLTDYVDCLIPRGGPSLIKSIRDNATVPVIIDGDGNCHVYVDASADLDEAQKIVVNAKTQRPSVCNAAESLVVHAAVADAFVPRVAEHVAASTASSWWATTRAAALSAHVGTPRPRATSAGSSSTSSCRSRSSRISRRRSRT